ncbi:MAG: TIGR02206 family membrane protein [Akkermansia sp.]|nr:TIGR02206 family membrane protein [Akkermansia sp.]
MEETEAFVRWSASHWGAVIATVIVTIFILWSGIRTPQQEKKNTICRILAVVVGLIYLGDSGYIIISQHHGSWEQNLPLHYCSMMLLVAVIALWTRNRTACWVLYFGALTACLQGLITPALDSDFPTLRYIFFFCLHGILMPAALAVPLILRLRARFRDVLISLFLMDVYLLLIHPVNLMLGTNYGFTIKSPVPGCILDYLGPAPWYYVFLQLPVIGLFGCMYLFVRERDEFCETEATNSTETAA